MVRTGGGGGCVTHRLSQGGEHVWSKLLLFLLGGNFFVGPLNDVALSHGNDIQGVGQFGEFLACQSGEVVQVDKMANLFWGVKVAKLLMQPQW